MTIEPDLINNFFASDSQEMSSSPFLSPRSRRWAKNLTLKSAACAAILLVFAYISSFFSESISTLLLASVFFLTAPKALLDAINHLKEGRINIDVLTILAALTTILISSPYEGGLLLVLSEISKAIETATMGKVRSSLHELQTLAPKFALFIHPNGSVYERSLREITLGMRILVKAQEIVPLDGIIVEGTSSLDLSHLTGENVPTSKTRGDEVPAGARNLETALVIEVTRMMSSSTVAKISELIVAAEQAKPQTQKLIDRIGAVYVPVILMITSGIALGLPLVSSLSLAGHGGSLYRAITFLIAASPCALILATPIAYLSTIASFAKRGILMKGSNTIDALNGCKTIAFDKTGTLTTGDLICTAIRAISKNPKVSSLEALGIAAALERHVVHPIAKAILTKAAEVHAPTFELTHVEMIPGYGLQGMVYDNVPVLLGLAEYVTKNLSPENRDLLKEELSVAQREEKMITILDIGGELFSFHFADSVRQEMPKLISTLKDQGLQVLMLTGDRVHNAEKIARELGIEKVFADLRPEEKLKKVEELGHDEGLAMVGDGINDAPSLKRATVGISMGRIGSQTAIDASDVVLLNDDLGKLGWLFARASRTLRIIKGNIIIALGLILGTSLFALFGSLPLWAAVILHEGGTLFVGLNGLRLLNCSDQKF